MEVESKLIRRVQLEDLISHLTESNIEQAKNLLQEFLDNIDIIVNFIRRISRFRVFNFKLLGDLASTISNIKMKYSSFDFYLYQRGYFNDDSDMDIQSKRDLRPVEEYENPLKHDSLESIIYSDDIIRYTNYIAAHDIDIKHSYPFTINDMTDISVIHLIFYCASMKIVKYLVVNNTEIGNPELSYSLESNSEELVQFLADRGHSYDNLADVAISHHNNKIAKWLFENFSNRTDASGCIYFDNTEMLLYTLQNYGDFIDGLDTQDLTALHYAAMANDLLVAKFLLLIGASPDIEGYGDMTAIDFAKTDEMRELLSEEEEVCEELAEKYNDYEFSILDIARMMRSDMFYSH